MLRNRFEAELERQAAKAVKLAAASKLMSMPSSKSRTKRSDRARAITGGEHTQTQTHTQQQQAATEYVEQTLGGVKPRGKKKKRSALANASNPHHLRNYVPSRLPHSSSGITGGAGQQVNNPDVPLRFLSAEIPPRRRKKMLPVAPVQLTSPADEWICAFCEHDLFYGDEIEYRRAVRNRKKILRRRRRARERAAAAASGNSVLKTGMDRSGDDYEAGFEPALDEFVNVPKTTRWKGDVNKGERVSELPSGYG